MFYEVIPIKLFRQDSGTLTYSSDLNLRPGHIVSIPLGKTSTTGIVLKKVAKVNFKTKPITKILFDEPLPPHLLKSIVWLSEYYLTPLPTVAKLALPTGIGKKRRDTSKISTAAEYIAPDFPLNPAQKQALAELSAIEGNTKLLHGITGSGKTNIYLKLTSDSLAAGRSTILLVPEIALTSQLVQIFSTTFHRQIILIHSRQTEAERQRIWESILTATEPLVIVGPRSALFAPVKNLGLIIVDEAHESTYFQENPPRYSALRLASFMASAANATCLLGTATPLISDYYLAKTKNSLVSLKTKAKTSAIAPDIHIIDLGDHQNFTKNHYFANTLLTDISENLKNHQQTLIFHNRRGSAPLTICEKCGWQALCPHCFLPLTLHSDQFKLTCHTCGYTANLPHSCPECHHPSIIHKGFGTKLLESELKKLFPDAKIARFDADNTKTDSLDQRYADVKSGDIDIVIGTQTIARGLDLPKLATVGIVQADAGLSLPDYAAEERTFHLLTQVIGRVGRGHLDKASVFIQTFQPNHPAIQSAIAADYDTFSEYLLKKRRQQHFPPYTYLARLAVTYKTEKTTLSKIQKLHALCKMHPKLSVSTPMPAFHERTAAGFTWQITIRATSRTTILGFIKSIPANYGAHFYLDPPSLIQ